QNVWRRRCTPLTLTFALRAVRRTASLTRLRVNDDPSAWQTTNGPRRWRWSRNALASRIVIGRGRTPPPFGTPMCPRHSDRCTPRWRLARSTSLHCSPIISPHRRPASPPKPVGNACCRPDAVDNHEQRRCDRPRYSPGACPCRPKVSYVLHDLVVQLPDNGGDLTADPSRHSPGSYSCRQEADGLSLARHAGPSRRTSLPRSPQR